jgi:hypothetical protein
MYGLSNADVYNYTPTAAGTIQENLSWWQNPDGLDRPVYPVCAVELSTQGFTTASGPYTELSSSLSPAFGVAYNAVNNYSGTIAVTTTETSGKLLANKAAYFTVVPFVGKATYHLTVKWKKSGATSWTTVVDKTGTTLGGSDGSLYEDQPGSFHLVAQYWKGAAKPGTVYADWRDTVAARAASPGVLQNDTNVNWVPPTVSNPTVSSTGFSARWLTIALHPKHSALYPTSWPTSGANPKPGSTTPDQAPLWYTASYPVDTTSIDSQWQVLRCCPVTFCWAPSINATGPSGGCWSAGDACWTVDGSAGGTLIAQPWERPTLTYRFYGDTLVWVYTTGPNCGIARVAVDGVDQGTVDQYSSTVQYQVKRSYSGLGADYHVVQIVSDGSKNAASTDYQITHDAFVAMTSPDDPRPATQTIQQDNTDGSTMYTWPVGENSLAHGGKYSFTSLANSATAYTFSGTGVTWLYGRGPRLGYADVYIDGSYKGRLDLYAAALSFTSQAYAGLASGTHTILVVAQPNGSRCGVISDAFQVGGTTVEGEAASYMDYKDGTVAFTSQTAALISDLQVSEDSQGVVQVALAFSGTTPQLDALGASATSNPVTICVPPCAKLQNGGFMIVDSMNKDVQGLWHIAGHVTHSVGDYIKDASDGVSYTFHLRPSASTRSVQLGGKWTMEIGGKSVVAFKLTGPRNYHLPNGEQAVFGLGTIAALRSADLKAGFDPVTWSGPKTYATGTAIVTVGGSIRITNYLVGPGGSDSSMYGGVGIDVPPPGELMPQAVGLNGLLCLGFGVDATVSGQASIGVSESFRRTYSGTMTASLVGVPPVPSISGISGQRIASADTDPYYCDKDPSTWVYGDAYLKPRVAVHVTVHPDPVGVWLLAMKVYNHLGLHLPESAMSTLKNGQDCEVSWGLYSLYEYHADSNPALAYGAIWVGADREVDQGLPLDRVMTGWESASGYKTGLGLDDFIEFGLTYNVNSYDYWHECVYFYDGGGGTTRADGDGDGQPGGSQVTQPIPSDAKDHLKLALPPTHQLPGYAVVLPKNYDTSLQAIGSVRHYLTQDGTNQDGPQGEVVDLLADRTQPLYPQAVVPLQACQNCGKLISPYAGLLVYDPIYGFDYIDECPYCGYLNNTFARVIDGGRSQPGAGPYQVDAGVAAWLEETGPGSPELTHGSELYLRNLSGQAVFKLPADWHHKGDPVGTIREQSLIRVALAGKAHFVAFTHSEGTKTEYQMCREFGGCAFDPQAGTFGDEIELAPSGTASKDELAIDSVDANHALAVWLKPGSATVPQEIWASYITTTLGQEAVQSFKIYAGPTWVSPNEIQHLDVCCAPAKWTVVWQESGLICGCDIDPATKTPIQPQNPHNGTGYVIGGSYAQSGGHCYGPVIADSAGKRLVAWSESYQYVYYPGSGDYDHVQTFWDIQTAHLDGITPGDAKIFMAYGDVPTCLAVSGRESQGVTTAQWYVAASPGFSQDQTYPVDAPLADAFALDQ